MTKSPNACQSFKVNFEISFETFKNSSFFVFVLFRKVVYILVDLPDFREGQVENLG